MKGPVVVVVEDMSVVVAIVSGLDIWATCAWEDDPTHARV